MSDGDGYQWYRWAAAVRARDDIRCPTKLVAAALASHADNNSGQRWPRQGTLAEECAISVSAVGKAVSELRRIGSLEVDHGKGRRSSRYTLIPAGSWVPIGHPTVRPMRSPGRPGGRGSVAPEGDAGSPGGAAQGHPTVRPELLIGPTEGPPPRTTSSSTSTSIASPQQQQASNRSSEAGLLASGDVVVDVEIVGDEDGERPVEYVDQWAQIGAALRREKVEEVATPEEEALLERARNLLEEAA